MAQKSRTELQGLFKTGAKPSQQDFSDLIDSTINVKDDGIEKPSGIDTPLKIKAQGTDEKLLDFYAGDKNTWSINQRTDQDKFGLNISSSGSSKLFIDSSRGNVGIGTTIPVAKLEISGDIKLQNGVAVNNISIDGTLTGNSDLAIPTEKAIKTYADTKALLAGSSTQDFTTKSLTVNGNLKLPNGVEVNNISIDGTLKGNSDLAIPTEKAIKTYADTKALLAGSSNQDFSAKTLQVENCTTKSLTVNVDGSGGWNKFVVNTTSDWGDGTAKHVTIGAGGASGIMLFNPHITWQSSEKRASIRYGRSGGVQSGTFWDVGVREDRSFSFAVNGNTDQKLSLSSTGDLTVNGIVRANTFSATNPLIHRMYPANPLVHQDIFQAVTAGRIKKLGNPTRYVDNVYTSANLWNGRTIICYGANNETDGNGAEVIIPEGYNTVWVRVLGGDRWNVIKAYFLDGNREDLGLWCGGFRSGNSYCPDGSLSDSYKEFHQWLPIPAGRSGRLALISKPNTSSEFWISGLAFSSNPWSHAAQSAIGYHWKSNGGDATWWGDNWHNWNSDVLSKIDVNTNELRVPVVPSGRDKLLYLIEHNNSWNGCMHSDITVNGTSIERFLSTYDNPFARHWNSKFYNRYIAARIPASLIQNNTRYLSVRINMQKQNEGINFREIGTHDLEPS
jgi:hypothetical protein